MDYGFIKSKKAEVKPLRIAFKYIKRDPVEKVMKSGVLSYVSAWRPGGGVVNDAPGHNED